MDEIKSTGPQVVTPQEQELAALPARSAGGGRLASLAAHLVSALLTFVALIFVVWFALNYRDLPSVFLHLKNWNWAGGDFDAFGFVCGIAGVAAFIIIGWLYLEGHELYLPHPARLCLAFIFGMGLAGFVLECLAIPHMLIRETIGLSLAALIALLLMRAWWRAGRPPASGVGGEAGVRDMFLRRELARAAEKKGLICPRGFFPRLFQIAAFALLALITLAIFWHALLYPEVYWDSLILYLGYARMTFLEHGFPVKVTGQVGIGLGANYPHLFAVLGSGIATAAGSWSELPQRLIAPLCGLASTVLIYQTVLRISRNVNFALAITLLYRAVPLGIAYDTYASDYALAVLFAAAFLYLALLYVETALPGYLAASALLIGLAMHLNYLMGILWLGWGVMLIAAHAGDGKAIERARGTSDPITEAPWITIEPRPGFWSTIFTPRLWTALIIALVIGSTWYVRNFFVTGNPVYAFFFEKLGGRNINPDVMAAAGREWMANGAGIGRLDAVYPNRLRALWTFFTGIGPNGGLIWPQAYQLAPLTMGFALMGGLIGLARFFAAPLLRKPRPAESAALIRYGLIPAVLALALLAFHLYLAPYYTYQIIKIIPCLALLAALAWPFWRRRPWALILGGLALWTGLIPGLAMSLMGFKIAGMVLTPGRPHYPTELFVLRNPLPRNEDFYTWRFGDDARMWSYINEHIPGQKLLTHENRHLVYDPTIQIIQLDDWDMQDLWKIPDPAERVRRLTQDFDIHYYLYIPNELACDTNARMGTADWPRLGLANLIFQAGENRLYQLQYPPALITTPTSATTPAAPKPVPQSTPPAPKPAPTPTPTPPSTPNASTTTPTLPAHPLPSAKPSTGTATPSH